MDPNDPLRGRLMKAEQEEADAQEADEDDEDEKPKAR